jgi:mannitol 2-dehydrogenase
MIDFCDTTPAAIIARLADPAIRIVSLTVTEGGYFVTPDGAFDTNHPAIKADAVDPAHPKTVFGILIAALKGRRAAGQPPFTVMSCDNLPENGHVAKQAVTGLAQMIDPKLADWIASDVAFPCGMVDCITPATSDRERKLVADTFGIEDAAPVTCEPFRQWVLEDRFPQGRPAFEAVGVEFVEDVAPYELMKLRILNGGHAAIAYPAALLGVHYVHDALGDADIRGWLMHLQRSEVIPTVPTIPGVDFDTYLETCARRFSNHVVADTIPRLCLDGSNRQPKFILPTLTAALAQDRPIDGLALETALWCRYCAGTAEDGAPIPLQDERAAQLTAAALEARTNPQAFLNIRDVFGDLAANDRYASAFAGHVKRLWQDGTRAVLQRYHGGA